MKTQADKTQESQNLIAPKVASEPSDGGTTQLVDNRTSTIDQRKLQDAMYTATDNNTNPIQRKNNTGLPDNLKTGIENLSGYSMNDVKVHYNSSKPAQLQAHAYAQGTDIHLAPGQQKHLPHEAWHVVQQKQGRVKPTMQFKGKVNVNDDAGLEKEADVMGMRALKNQNTQRILTIESKRERKSNIVQRVWLKSEDDDTYLYSKSNKGLTWFRNNQEEYWFKIVDYNDIPPEKLQLVKEHEGEIQNKSYWKDLEVFPFILELDTTKAFQGWDNPFSHIDWTKMTQQRLENLQATVIVFGIVPMLQEFFEDTEEVMKIIDRSRKIKIFSKEEFALRSYHYGIVKKQGSATRPKQEIWEEVKKYYKETESSWAKDQEIKNYVIATSGDNQGQEIHGISCINKDKAEGGQGLNLIIHETMHSLTDPSVKDILREKGLVFGDEGVNEFFTRLAHLMFMSKTGETFKHIIGSPKGGGAHKNLYSESDRGIYGDLMDRIGYTDLEHIDSEDKLKELAKFYFSGKVND